MIDDQESTARIATVGHPGIEIQKGETELSLEMVEARDSTNILFTSSTFYQRRTTPHDAHFTVAIRTTNAEVVVDVVPLVYYLLDPLSFFF